MVHTPNPIHHKNFKNVTVLSFVSHLFILLITVFNSYLSRVTKLHMGSHDTIPQGSQL